MRIYHDKKRGIEGHMNDFGTYLIGPIFGEMRLLAEMPYTSVSPEEQFRMLQELADECWQTVSVMWMRKRRKKHKAVV